MKYNELLHPQYFFASKLIGIKESPFVSQHGNIALFDSQALEQINANNNSKLQ